MDDDDGRARSGDAGCRCVAAWLACRMERVEARSASNHVNQKSPRNLDAARLSQASQESDLLQRRRGRSLWPVQYTPMTTHCNHCCFGLYKPVEHCTQTARLPPVFFRVANTTHKSQRVRRQCNFNYRFQVARHANRPCTSRNPPGHDRSCAAGSLEDVSTSRREQFSLKRRDGAVASQCCSLRREHGVHMPAVAGKQCCEWYTSCFRPVHVLITIMAKASTRRGCGLGKAPF
jgi:hypothetical protein